MRLAVSIAALSFVVTCDDVTPPQSPHLNADFERAVTSGETGPAATSPGTSAGEEGP